MTPIVVKTFLAWTALQFILAPGPILIGLLGSSYLVRHIFPQTAPWVPTPLWLLQKFTQGGGLMCLLIFMVAMCFGFVALYRWARNGTESSMPEATTFTEQIKVAAPVPATSPFDIRVALGTLISIFASAGAITFNLFASGSVSTDKSLAENISGVGGFMAGGLEVFVAGFVVCLIVFSIRRWRNPAWLADVGAEEKDPY
ncbi:hypothetical protein FB45DRAFT_944478 [Roridomyces roridus]|uniref:Uncharacterized protein n=1 Tax=Roridomyces roridus TaxID=1738132 RepID=A0AAD7B382_9AGAR|nr:hypothetical protein FB45DRAFT_944478 [Roridomyces roridus]